MLDFSFWELAVVGMVALLVIGPKELPNALRHLGRLTGKARAMTRHLRSGFDEMVRQAEMEEMEKQWRDQNAKIMAQNPPLQAEGDHPDYGGGETPPTEHVSLPSPLTETPEAGSATIITQTSDAVQTTPPNSKPAP